jgi:hypothetical protein
MKKGRIRKDKKKRKKEENLARFYYRRYFFLACSLTGEKKTLRIQKN